MAVMGAERRSGRMTPSTPAPSAVRRSAPRLWGSSTPSRARKKRWWPSARGGEEVFDGEELALANEGDDALMGVGLGEPGELVAGLEGDADAGGAGEGDEPFEAVVAAFAGDGDVVELSGAGADGLFDGVEAVENFHIPSLPSERNSEPPGAVEYLLRVESRLWRDGFPVGVLE